MNINEIAVGCLFIIYLAGMDIEDKNIEKNSSRNAPNLPWVEKYRPSHLN
jgi:hypothetical protein